MTKVFIDGQEGTTGLRIFDRLSARKDISLLRIDNARRKDAFAKRALFDEADIVFLCLPDAAARESEALLRPELTVIDASTAHRTLPGWAYGFPELSSAHRRAIGSGKRIAVPGCHASGFNAIVYPLVSSGIMPKDYPLVSHSLTGYSGGGKKMIAQYEDSERDAELSSPRMYALTQEHKHLKEMQAVPGLSRPPIFTPIVADYYSGMAVTVPVFTGFLPERQTVNSIFSMFADHYANERLVHVSVREDGFIGSNNLSGRDDMEILISGNDERVIVTARFDNLGKGASGAAVQCMNIAMGIDECTGLVFEV